MAPWSQIVMWLGEPVVLPNQLVGTVILVGDGSRPLSDRGYAPIVVVSEGIDVVAAILVQGHQRYFITVIILYIRYLYRTYWFIFIWVFCLCC